VLTMVGTYGVRHDGSRQTTPSNKSVDCKDGEVPLLRRLLARNAQRLVVPPWQRDLLKGGPGWSATFLPMLYCGEAESIENYLKRVVMACGGVATGPGQAARPPASPEQHMNMCKSM
jgi:hypothetical protein